MPTADPTFHALDAKALSRGEPRDPCSIDVHAEPCDLCNGCGRVEYIEGDAVPARWVSAGGGDRVRCGEPCPACIAAVESLVAEECGP